MFSSVNFMMKWSHTVQLILLCSCGANFMMKLLDILQLIFACSLFLNTSGSVFDRKVVCARFESWEDNSVEAPISREWSQPTRAPNVRHFCAHTQLFRPSPKRVRQDGGLVAQ